MSRLLLAMLALILLFPAHSRADLVRLRDGKSVEGRIRSQTPRRVIIRTPRGVRIILKSNIDEIEYRPFTFPTVSRSARQPRKQEPKRASVRRHSEDKTAARRRALEEKHRGARRGSEGWSPLFGIIGRGALLPGWGHLHGGRAGRARWVGGIFAASAGVALAFERHASNRKKIYKSAGRENLALALALPSNRLLGASIDLKRLSGIVLTGRWNNKGARYNRARDFADLSAGLLLVYYFAQILDAAWPEIVVAGRAEAVRITWRLNL